MRTNQKIFAAFLVISLMVGGLFLFAESSEATSYSFTASSNDGSLGSVTCYRYDVSEVWIAFTSPANIEEGTQIRVVATPTTGNNFKNWTSGGSAVSTSSTYEFYMPSGSYTIVGNFTGPLYTVDASPNNSSYGRIDCMYEESEGHWIGFDEPEDFPAGTKIEMSAASFTGYHFVNWTVNGSVVSTSEFYTFTMPANNYTVVCNFAANATYTYTLQSSNSNYGACTAYTYMPPDYQTQMIITTPYTATQGLKFGAIAYPTPGYYFVNWTVNGVIVSTDTTYEFTMPGENYTVIGNFAAMPVYNYSLTYDANGGAGAPEADTQSTTAQTCNFTISDTIPTRTGYDFLGWADSDDAVAAQYFSGDTLQLGYSDPTKTIYAVWAVHEAPTYTYTLKFNGNGGSGVPVNMTAVGTEVTYDFTIPNTKPTKENVIFVGWSLAPTATAASYSPGSQITVGADQEVLLYAVYNEDNSFSFSFDYLIKQIANTFFGGSSSLAGLAMIVICWLLIIAVLANMKAPIVYSVAPMIPIVIIFAAMGIVSTDITMLVIIVCAVLSAGAVRNIVKGD